MFMMLSFSFEQSRLNSRPPACFPLSPYEATPGIFGDHLAHLIVQIPPYTNEIARTRDGHRLGALLFEYGDNGAGFRLNLPGLNPHMGLEHLRHPIELQGNG